MVITNTFAKTICSICYEDLKPIVEDLQAISVCGHVFHELCLQQWFEYCTSKNKHSCPVCKQSCSDKSVGRLYFQSVGDSTDLILSQKPVECQEDPEVLRREVRRLEGKVSGFSAVLERQGNEIKVLTGELSFFKEKAEKESTLKKEALKQKISIEQLLHFKAEELNKSNSECAKLQEKNMALAKELAALKLVSDLSLDEDEVLKLASFGNEANKKDTIDVLRRSLVIRNKSYKELMAKCNLLGRGEARYCKKLEKAKEKIQKLKFRVQELETAAEAKDNEVLRAIKISKSSCHQAVKNGLDVDSNSLPIGDALELTQIDKSAFSKSDSVRNESKNHAQQSTGEIKLEQFTDTHISNKEDASKVSMHMHGHLYPEENPKNPDFTVQKSFCPRPEEGTHDKKHISGQAPSSLAGSSNLRNGFSNNGGKAPPADVDDVILLDDPAQPEPLLNIRKENSSPVVFPQPGDVCFAGGLLGPDGTNRYLGKWCKRSHKNGSVASQGPSTSTGDLIAIGADGRGGRIKVLKSLNQSSLDGKEITPLPKRSKIGAKTGSFHLQGRLQIEHFFGRASH